MKEYFNTLNMWKTAEVHKHTSWRNLDKITEKPKKAMKKMWKQNGSRKSCSSAKGNENFATDFELFHSYWNPSDIRIPSHACNNHSFNILKRFWQVTKLFSIFLWTALSFHLDNCLLSYPRLCYRVGLLKMNVFAFKLLLSPFSQHWSGALFFQIWILCFKTSSRLLGCTNLEMR